MRLPGCARSPLAAEILRLPFFQKKGSRCQRDLRFIRNIGLLIMILATFFYIVIAVSMTVVHGHEDSYSTVFCKVP
jgi:hypothetical protein